MEKNDYILQVIRRYVDKRQAPSSFVMSILTNDLRGAIGNADHINMRRIPEIVGYCWNEIPPACWGSPEAVKGWLDYKENEDDKDSEGVGSSTEGC